MKSSEDSVMGEQNFSIEIDLGGKCICNSSFNHFKTSKENFRIHGNLLSLNEIKDLITQAGKLGVQHIILINEEFSPHPDTHEITAFINRNNIQVKSFFAGVNSDIIECKKPGRSCFISCDGMVYPCAGMPLPIGNIRKNSLKRILEDSEVVENIRNHTRMIKGPCRECDQFFHCYGCRGRAFALTGDYLASDPICPKNQDKPDKITTLPMSTEHLIPQKQSMRVVSRLLKIGERYGKVESVFSKNSPFINQDGSIDEMAYMEIMAQSAATMNGFEKFDTGAPDPGGFLIGGQKIRIYTKAYAGEKLITDIYKTTKFGNFGILTATIKRQDDLIADGEIKIYKNDGVSDAL
ncbi:MAG: SPASM domain-containing protein [Pseudomonadota bacterium]